MMATVCVTLLFPSKLLYQCLCAFAYRYLCRIKFLWRDVIFVTDPHILYTIMGRGAGSLDKAVDYSVINHVSQKTFVPHV